MAQPEAGHSKVSVFHEYDGTTYSLTFADPETGESIMRLVMRTEEIRALASAIVSSLVEHDIAEMP